MLDIRCIPLFAARPESIVRGKMLFRFILNLIVSSILKFKKLELGNKC